MQQDFEIIVIGAGIAGASAAAYLGETHKVAILEMEERPGYHTTGRSAAAFEPNYEPPPIRALTRAARRFFESPPPAFGASPLITPRATIFLVPPSQNAAAQQFAAGSHGLQEIGFSEAKKRHPFLRDGYAKTGFLDEGTSDIDVDLLHQGFLRLFKAAGGVLVCHAAASARPVYGRLKRNKDRFAPPFLSMPRALGAMRLRNAAELSLLGCNPSGGAWRLFRGWLAKISWPGRSSATSAKPGIASRKAASFSSRPPMPPPSIRTMPMPMT
jgi:hypothetical protein